VALVTGGATGIGRSACLLLARQGASVAVTDVLDEEGCRRAREILNAGCSPAYWQLNVSEGAEVKRVFADINTKFGHIDVLVNNTGISGVNKPTHEIIESEWDTLTLDRHLRDGLNIYDRNITHPAVAEALELPDTRRRSW
jgi:NAD(P)-dependent dehydrogenase (short-subunit alcohol dehydrogenase family)